VNKKHNTSGQKTREEILNRAVQIASVIGLEGITIGQLAKELSMSKSGLFGLFGSKEELQSAILQRAIEIFQQVVIVPIQILPINIKRFESIIENWLSYIENDTFEGGCIFISTSLEYDSRPGVIRDEMCQNASLGFEYLEQEARICLNPDAQPNDSGLKQLIFEIHSYLIGANLRYKLFNDRTVFDQARYAISKQLKFYVSQTNNKGRLES
jgi:AcrR family transcriptional regulator